MGGCLILQVVLVRDMSALEQLPSELTNSNALIMTVGQSKGLEFDDVFIVNFFGDSPCTPEWRVLMTLLDKAREGTMEVPAGVTWTEVVKAAEEAGALRPLDFDERQHR
jgi:superfamily I DNA/RNA helicase